MKGTAGTLIHQQPLSVTTGGHNFTQAVTPTTQNVTAGSSAAYTVVYTPFGGMNDDIAVGCGALPAGVTCTPVPAVVHSGRHTGEPVDRHFADDFRYDSGSKRHRRHLRRERGAE